MVDLCADPSPNPASDSNPIPDSGPDPVLVDLAKGRLGMVARLLPLDDDDEDDDDDDFLPLPLPFLLSRNDVFDDDDGGSIKPMACFIWFTHG